MSLAAPHFLLHAETAVPAESSTGRWRFVLSESSGAAALEAADDEPVASSERLELLAIVRGLEALDQPSRVTLVSASRSVQAGLKFGLANWRANDWQWERYGQLTAVKNADLWQRLDRLLEIHSVQCRPSRGRTADDLAAPPSNWRHLSRGRRLRMDQPAAKSQEPNNQITKRSGNNLLLEYVSSVLRFLGL